MGMSSNEDAALDEPTIREYLERSYPRLVAGLSLMCGSRAAAEDAVQEALARAWERSDRGEPIASLEAWMTTVSLNLARSRFRRLRVERKARERLAGEAGAHVEGPSGDRTDVVRALAALPRRQREVVVLRYYLDLEVAEVARTLGVSDGTVKTSLHRARKTLFRALSVGDEAEEVTWLVEP